MKQLRCILGIVAVTLAASTVRADHIDASSSSDCTSSGGTVSSATYHGTTVYWCCQSGDKAWAKNLYSGPVVCCQTGSNEADCGVYIWN